MPLEREQLAWQAAQADWRSRIRERIVEQHAIAIEAMLYETWLAGCRTGVQLTCRYVRAGPASAIGDEIGIGGVPDAAKA